MGKISTVFFKSLPLTANLVKYQGLTSICGDGTGACLTDGSETKRNGGVTVNLIVRPSSIAVSADTTHWRHYTLLTVTRSHKKPTKPTSPNCRKISKKCNWSLLAFKEDPYVGLFMSKDNEKRSLSSKVQENVDDYDTSSPLSVAGQA
ncbi:hypothetical protein J6590_004745 [Homalodisca vitripennis]|nr:hypothetical protein J6590_004745 [Homalodisca vitripennis]